MDFSFRLEAQVSIFWSSSRASLKGAFVVLTALIQFIKHGLVRNLGAQAQKHCIQAAPQNHHQSVFFPFRTLIATSRLLELIKNNRTSKRLVNGITPAIWGILEQIIHCPYHGLTRKFFIEGKVMELLA